MASRRLRVFALHRFACVASDRRRRLSGPLGPVVVREAVRMLHRALSEGQKQYAQGGRGAVDLAHLLPAPRLQGSTGRAVGLVQQGDAERSLVVGEQALLE